MRTGARLRRVVQEAFSGVDDALFAKADGAVTNQEQNDWFDVMRRLRVSRQEVEARLLQIVDQELDRQALQGVDIAGLSSELLVGAFYQSLGNMATMPLVGEQLIQGFRSRCERDAGRDAVSGLAVTESAAETPQEKTSLSGEEQKISRIVSQLFDLMIASCPYADMAARCLSALKPSVLGLAQGDPEFLNTREHPARLLLNDVVTGLSQADDPDAFVAEVLLLAGRLEGRLESRLLQSQVDATRIFEEELQAFRDQLEGGERRRLQQQRLCQAESDRARADLAREYVVEKIESVAKGVAAGRPVPDVVQQLLLGPWHNVMLLSYLKGGEDSSEWQAQLQVVRDLVMSVCTNFSSSSELLGLLPDLLSRLRKGIEASPHDLFKVNDLFRQLEKEHLARLQPAADIDEEPVTADKSQEASACEDSGDPWLEQVETLSPGCSFDVEVDGVEQRYRLAAFIRDANRLVFVDRNGLKAAEMTRRELADAMEDQGYRLVVADDLFDQALQTVITDLRKT